MSYSTATFTSAMFNILPAIAFFMAWIFRLETVNIRKLHSQAKVLGTIITVGGAIILTLAKGPALNLPWTKGKNQHHPHHQMQSDSNHKDITKSALLSAAACFCWSSFIILQAFTLKIISL
ncbi:WAT1-related protein At2g39510-like [Prunus avium]|uniref:WAT1-related protein At2g39510-like n=1 Tax=Prunus avium TaxID=42229 RepID=A0A6P5SCU7_PRUAV|nr:WAT1-related protein At2g39510-like [Prunus avium]